MRDTIRRWLGIEDLEGKVDDLSDKVADLSETVNAQTQDFYGYKNQTNERLYYMQGTIESLLRQAEERIQQDISDDEYERLKSVLRKLRYNRTKIQNALAAQG